MKPNQANNYNVMKDLRIRLGILSMQNHINESHIRFQDVACNPLINLDELIAKAVNNIIITDNFIVSLHNQRNRAIKSFPNYKGQIIWFLPMHSAIFDILWLYIEIKYRVILKNMFMFQLYLHNLMPNSTDLLMSTNQKPGFLLTFTNQHNVPFDLERLTKNVLKCIRRYML